MSPRLAHSTRDSLGSPTALVAEQLISAGPAVGYGISGGVPTRISAVPAALCGHIPGTAAGAADNRFRWVGTSRRDTRLDGSRAQRSLENHYEEAAHEQSDNPPAFAPAGICHRSRGPSRAASAGTGIGGLLNPDGALGNRNHRRSVQRRRG